MVRLLRSLQDAITKPNLRVPSLWSVFVAHGLAILAQPHHPQYKALNNYILTRAFFDLSDVALFFRCSTPECELRTTSHRLQVPMFFHCFHSGSSTPRDDRLWMLALLSHGLRAEEDARLCGGRHVLELLLGLSDSRGSATRGNLLGTFSEPSLGFSDSSLADPPARRACLAVLLRASGTADGASALPGKDTPRGAVREGCPTLPHRRVRPAQQARHPGVASDAALRQPALQPAARARRTPRRAGAVASLRLPRRSDARRGGARTLRWEMC